MGVDLIGTEYRVTWRRRGWSSRSASKSRTFARWADVARFVARLNGPDRPDLSRADVSVDWRSVGPWWVVTDEHR